MTCSKLVLALTAFALAAACEARIGGKDDAPAAAPGRTADAGAGEAEEGRLSIDAPGFQMKLDIPAALAERADVDSDSGILYPGATLSGMHVAARDGGESGKVALRFTSADPPARLAAWYRDPARAADFTIASERENAGAFAISGTQKEDGDPFDLSLRPRPGGGTDGSLRLRDKG